MSSIMRRRRGLKSAISILLSEGGGLQHPHPLSQEAIYATLPLTPRQRLRSIPSDSLFEECALAGGASRQKSRHLMGGAYWMPPALQSWLSPRGMPSFDPEPTLRS